MSRTVRVALMAACLAGGSLTAACESTEPTTSSVALATAHVNAAPPQGAAETGYFNGQSYQFVFPSGTSNNQNELLADCFRLGPDLTTHPAGPSARLYAIFLPGASLHSCPDGSVVHDHLLSTVPGFPGYTGHWDLLEAWPGPNFIPGIVPITSEADLLAAASAGQVIIIDDQLPLLAVVKGPIAP